MSTIRPIDRLQSAIRTPTLLSLQASAQAAPPGRPLLIRGEAGVGKDTLARLIHAGCAYRLQAFVKVRCSALSADPDGVDLFGLEQRASNPAFRRRVGSFELANHGTLYLDQIEALPGCLVPRLLHSIATGEVLRVGGREIIRVDARIVASTGMSHETSKLLDDDLRHGLERLHAVEIWIPPLRQRPHEIAAFAAFFVERMNLRYHRQAWLSPEALAELQAYTWPGNLGELEEAIRQLVVSFPTIPSPAPGREGRTGALSGGGPT